MTAQLVFQLVAELFLLRALLWYIRSESHVPMASSRQANHDRARHGTEGLLYFGAILGVGFLTRQSTPLVWPSVVLALASGPRWGLAYGVAFGVARSIPAWSGTAVNQSGDVLRLTRIFTRGPWTNRVGRGVSLSAFLGLVLVTLPHV